MSNCETDPDCDWRGLEYALLSSLMDKGSTFPHTFNRETPLRTSTPIT